MSLKLNSSGGGSITLQEPSTASNRTLTLPDNTGTVISTASTGVITQAMMATGVAGNGPAFSAYRATSNQTISSGVYTKLQFNFEEFDTNNNYDNTTNYRFLPTVAGYYMFTANLVAGGGPTYSYISLYKNGNNTVESGYSAPGGFSTTSGLIYLNGTTDYVEVYCYVSSTSILATTKTQFTGFLARAA